MSWKDIGDWAFYAATAITITFALLYGFLAPWWETVAGRNIIAVMGSVALAFGYFSWAISVGGIPPGFDMTRALLFIGIGAAIGWRTVIFIRVHLLRSLRGDPKGDNKNELENSR
jgi:hypothetical protein